MSGVDDISRLTLEPTLTIFHVAELREVLMSRLQDYDEFEVDLSRVDEVDAAGMQLLAALKRESKERGKRVRLTGQGSTVARAAELLGLPDIFRDPPPVSSNNSGGDGNGS